MGNPIKRGESSGQVSTWANPNDSYTPLSQTSLLNPFGLTLRQAITSSGSVTIPAGITWVYVVMTSAGSGGSTTGSGGSAGGVAWGWTVPQSTCIIGAGVSTGPGGYTRYGNVIAVANGGTAGLTNYWAIPGGSAGSGGGAGNVGSYGGAGNLNTTLNGTGGNGGNGISGGSGATSGVASGTGTSTGGNGGNGLVGGGGGGALPGNTGTRTGGDGGNGLGIDGTVYTGGTGTSGTSTTGAGGGGAGIAGNGSNASGATGGNGGLGGGGAGGTGVTSGNTATSGAGILYIFY
jgi:hypothetical protein